MRQSQMVNMGRKDTKVDPLADQDIDEENKDDEIFDFELSEEDEEDSAEEYYLLLVVRKNNYIL